MDELATAAEFLRQWMLQVMQAKDWNAEEWAAKAGTTATNITRFLKGSQHIPSYSTLVKLADAAGVPIPTPGMVKADIPQFILPLLKSDQLDNPRADPAKLAAKAKESVVTRWNGRRAFAVLLDHDRFKELGYMAGDILVVDPDLTPEPGKHVLATNGERSGPCRYEPPHIYCAAGKRHVMLKEITLIGTIVELIRRMV